MTLDNLLKQAEPAIRDRLRILTFEAQFTRLREQRHQLADQATADLLALLTLFQQENTAL
jgi:hypothetical protein